MFNWICRYAVQQWRSTIVIMQLSTMFKSIYRLPRDQTISGITRAECMKVVLVRMRHSRTSMLQMTLALFPVSIVCSSNKPIVYYSECTVLVQWMQIYAVLYLPVRKLHDKASLIFLHQFNSVYCVYICSMYLVGSLY